MNAIVQIKPSRLPIAASIAKEFEVSSAQWRVLVEQIFPSAKSVESVMMALSYCKARSLDIYKKPVHIVPMYSTALKRMVETVWPGIAEIRTTAARTGEYAGIDAVQFGPMTKKAFVGKFKDDEDKWVEQTKEVEFPEWASVVVYRLVKGVRCPFHAIVYWTETYASMGKSDIPNKMWEKRPRGQIGKCVEAAGLRMAFPEEVGSMYAAEEMEGRVIDHDTTDIPVAAPPMPPRPPLPPAPPSPPALPAPVPAEDTPLPEEILRDAEDQFAACPDLETVEEVWDQFTEALTKLSVEDAQHLLGLYEAAQRRFEG